jgi:hypothetical protein
MFPPVGNPNPVPNQMHHPSQQQGPGGVGQHQAQGNMPNGVMQRPGSVQMGGTPMSLSHQPIPLTLQPSGPQANMQPNTMIPQPANANAAMMMNSQMSGNVSLFFVLLLMDSILTRPTL